MIIWLISDTHGSHNLLEIPKCDAIIHCGDFSNSHDPVSNMLETKKFFNWLKTLDIPVKIVSCGNHDISAHRSYNLVEDELKLKENGIQLLIHQEFELFGMKGFASPYTPMFGSDKWAYLKNRHTIDRVWSQIPDDVELLITHGPPKGILDLAQDIETNKTIPVGCSALRKRVLKISPTIHAFGHIHNNEESPVNYGVYDNSKTKFINCSCVWDRGKGFNHGILMKIEDLAK